MKDNTATLMLLIGLVVNCFQKLLSSWWRTTKGNKATDWTPLWIAFKNYYLRDEGQHRFAVGLLSVGCELLSKIIIFVMKDNIGWWFFISSAVVNCFQKLLSSWWRTTQPIYVRNRLWLWIAFKNYYLRDEGQPKNGNLLRTPVVNCFQKLLSSWWRTARLPTGAFKGTLWIAFKNYYLRDEGQQNTRPGL